MAVERPERGGDPRLERPVTRWLLPAVLLMATLAPSGSFAAAAAFEEPAEVPAARFLTPGERAGADWKVADTATNDGFGNTYTVESRFGSWRVQGRLQLATRVREIEALAELERVSKTDVFLAAVKRSAVGQIETVASFAARPVETVAQIPGAAKRWFQRTSFQVREAYVDAKEVAAEVRNRPDSAETPAVTSEQTAEAARELAQREVRGYLKISVAERRWYASLGVDPYTDNEVLRKVVRSYARVEGLTSFGMKFVGLPVVPGAAQLRKTMQLVWKTEPSELRLRNRKVLRAAGVSEETARRFEDCPALSLTHQTVLVDLLQELAGVAGREHLLARAIELQSRTDAQALLAAVNALAQLHRDRGLATFLAGTALPAGRTRDETLVTVVPSDALFWTASVAEAARTFAAVYAGERAESRELWVTGVASPRFAAETKALGWKVRNELRVK